MLQQLARQRIDPRTSARGMPWERTSEPCSALPCSGPLQREPTGDVAQSRCRCGPERATSCTSDGAGRSTERASEGAPTDGAQVRRSAGDDERNTGKSDKSDVGWQTKLPKGTEGGPVDDPQTSTSHRARGSDDPCSATLTIRPSLFPQLIVLTVAAPPIVPHSCPSMLTACNTAKRVLRCAVLCSRPNRSSRLGRACRIAQALRAAVYPVVHNHLPPQYSWGDAAGAQAVRQERATLSTAYVAWRSTVHHAFAWKSVCVHEPAP